MKITHVEGFPIRIPGRAYMGGHAAASHTRRIGNYVKHAHYRSIYSLNSEAFLVKITTDEGIVGWGEAQCAIGPEILQAILEHLLTPFLLDQDADDVESLRDGAYDLMRERGHDGGFYNDAIAACDIALWDIAGKKANKPVYELLGGAQRNELPCYVSGVPAADADEQVEKIREWIQQGFTAFKISLGGSVEHHVQRMQRLRDEFGESIQLTIDAHWAFELSEAIELAEKLKPLNIRFLECSLIPEDVESLAKLAATVDMPIALGEEYRTRYRFGQLLACGALSVVQADVGRLGITEMQRVIAMSQSYGATVAPHLGTGLALYTAAGLHLAAAAANFDIMEFQPTQIAISDDYFSPSLRPASGCFQLPPGPGLGVEPNEQRLRQYVLSR